MEAADDTLSQLDFSGWAERYPDSELAQLARSIQSRKTLNVETLSTGNDLLDAALRIVCRYCKTADPLVWHTQSRSADEGMTANYLCVNPQCGQRWRQNT